MRHFNWFHTLQHAPQHTVTHCKRSMTLFADWQRFGSWRGSDSATHTATRTATHWNTVSHHLILHIAATHSHIAASHPPHVCNALYIYVQLSVCMAATSVYISATGSLSIGKWLYFKWAVKHVRVTCLTTLYTPATHSIYTCNPFYIYLQLILYIYMQLILYV